MVRKDIYINHMRILLVEMPTRSPNISQTPNTRHSIICLSLYIQRKLEKKVFYIKKAFHFLTLHVYFKLFECTFVQSQILIFILFLHFQTRSK